MGKNKKTGPALDTAAGNCVMYAMLGVTEKDENGEEKKAIISVPREMVPETMGIGDEGEIEFYDGEKTECVLIAIGGYDPEIMDGPPSPEEILEAFEE